MDRLPSLGSLRSLANYGQDEVDSDDEHQVARKKAKTEEEKEDENPRSKDDGSDLDIVVSDEENDSSMSGSTESKIVVTQPRVNIASRLVSYVGDEDEEEDATRMKENDVDDAPETELQETFPSELPSKEIEEKPEVKSTSEETKNNSSSLEKQTNEDIIPKELHYHLATVKSIQATLPEEPDGRCSNSLQEKIEKLLETKQRTGRDYTDTIQRKKNFRNPSIYDKLVSFCSINETGTNYPKHIYDPFSWTEESFYENLSKLQKETYDKKQKERSKVEFVSAIKKSVTTADDAAKKRKSKWDVTSSGIAVPVSSHLAPQSIVSVQAVVAAKAKVINTVATMQAKKG